MRSVRTFKNRVYLATWTFVLPVALFAESKKPASVEEDLRPVRGNEQASEVHALKAELLIAKTESQAMAQLNKLLKRYSGTAMEPGLLLRKAELFARMSKTERFLEVSRDS